MQATPGDESLMLEQRRPGNRDQQEQRERGRQPDPVGDTQHEPQLRERDGNDRNEEQWPHAYSIDRARLV
jgi:hypothetical protein